MEKKEAGFYEKVMTVAGSIVGEGIAYEATMVRPWEMESGWEILGAFAVNAVITISGAVLGGIAGKKVGGKMDEKYCKVKDKTI